MTEQSILGIQNFVQTTLPAAANSTLNVYMKLMACFTKWR